MENSTEAKALLHAVLARARAGLKVEPSFHLRLVMALSTIESRDGNHAAALAYLESSELSAREVAEKSLKIASGICIYTNGNITVEELA